MVGHVASGDGDGELVGHVASDQFCQFYISEELIHRYISSVQGVL